MKFSLENFTFEIVDSIGSLFSYFLKLNLYIPKKPEKQSKMTHIDIHTLVSL